MLTGLPEPVPDLDSQPFWDGCQEGRFLLPTCTGCGKARWPPGPICPYCQSSATDWVAVAGTGHVYSWVVVTHSVHPATAEQLPYVSALIELPEGVRVVGNVVGCPPEEVTAGMAVELFFEAMPSGFRLPNFRRPSR